MKIVRYKQEFMGEKYLVFVEKPDDLEISIDFAKWIFLDRLRKVHLDNKLRISLRRLSNYEKKKFEQIEVMRIVKLAKKTIEVVEVVC